MVAYLKKPTGSEGFQEIVDFLNGIISVDGKEFIVTEAFVRRHLQLADTDGISVLPNTKIFDQLSQMRYVFTDDKLTFQKEEGEGSVHPSELQPPPSTAQPTHEEPIPVIASSSHQKTQTPRQALHTVTELPQTSEPILNVADEAVYEEWDDIVKRATTTDASLDVAQLVTRSERVPTQSDDSPFLRVNTLGSDEGSMPLQELTVLCTTLSQKVESLEADLKQTKQVYGAAYNKLIKKVSTQREAHSQEDQPKDQLGVFSAAKVLADAAKVHTYSRRGRAVSTGSGGISTASRLFSTAEESVSTVGASMPVSTTGMSQEVNMAAVKDKGKGIMTEFEPMQTKTKRQQEQERLSLEAAEEWENIRARVEADEELTQRLQAEEQNKYSEVDQAKMLVDLINQRKRYFAAKRAEERRNKPMTQAQQRTYMSNYIKHIGSYTLKQLKKLSFDEIKELFEATMRSINDFVPMKTEGRASVLAAGSSQAVVTESIEAGGIKRTVEEEFDQQSTKKLKIGKSSKPRNKDVDDVTTVLPNSLKRAEDD
nr:hypothetical protein [Tanacetum cinerariifolium]